MTDIARVRRALADAVPASYWLDQPDAPSREPALTGSTSADLAIVGAGFTGLWTALLAKERDPSRDVLVLEAESAGWAASGRNGGFCAASLTHGLANGVERFPDEVATLEKLGHANLDEIAAAIDRYGIDCAFERTGELNVATAPWQVDGLREDFSSARGYGHEVELLDRDGVRDEVASPTYLGGLWDRTGCATLDPARLAWGLRAACLSLGVRIHEGTPVTSITPRVPGCACGRHRAQWTRPGWRSGPVRFRRCCGD